MWTVDKCVTKGLALVVSGILIGVTAAADRAAAQSMSVSSPPSSISRPASDAKMAAAIVPLGASSSAYSPSLYAAPPPPTTSVLLRPPAARQASLTSNLGSDIHREFAKLSPEARRAMQDFQIASAQFPSFCKDWERRLGDRERDNVSHLAWQMRNGVETGTYLGYSKIESCISKQASNGVPIGELSYHEINYAKTGTNVAAAEHAPPKVTSESQTMEIFSWDKGKWFY